MIMVAGSSAVAAAAKRPPHRSYRYPLGATTSRTILTCDRRPISIIIVESVATAATVVGGDVPCVIVGVGDDVGKATPDGIIVPVLCWVYLVDIFLYFDIAVADVAAGGVDSDSIHGTTLLHGEKLLTVAEQLRAYWLPGFRRRPTSSEGAKQPRPTPYRPPPPTIYLVGGTNNKWFYLVLREPASRGFHMS